MASFTTRPSPARVCSDQRLAPRKRFAPGNGHSLGRLETFGSSRLRKIRVCWPGSPAGGPPCAELAMRKTARAARAEEYNRGFISVSFQDSQAITRQSIPAAAARQILSSLSFDLDSRVLDELRVLRRLGFHERDELFGRAVDRFHP